MTFEAHLTDLQRRWRLAMACGRVNEMGMLSDQIARLRKAHSRRVSTQTMLAVVPNVLR